MENIEWIIEKMEIIDRNSPWHVTSDAKTLMLAFAKTEMKIKKESRGNRSTITIRKIDFKSGI